MEEPVEPTFPAFVSPSVSTRSNLLPNVPDFLGALPNLESLQNMTVGPQNLYVIPEAALFRNTAALAGLIAGCSLLGLLFMLAVVGFILDQCGILDYFLATSEDDDASDIESGKPAADGKTASSNASKSSQSRNSSAVKKTSSSTASQSSVIGRKSNENQGMKYWFSAQHPRRSSRRQFSRAEIRHSRTRKLSPGSDGGSIFNFFCG